MFLVGIFDFEREDDESCDRTKSSRTEVNITAVAGLFKSDLRIASRMIAESLKVVCTFYSTLLDTWANGRSTLILSRIYRDGRWKKKYFNKIITGNGPDTLHYVPETKRQISEWVGGNSPLPKNLKLQRSCIKNMLTIFFNSQGVVHKKIRTRGKNSKCRIL